MSISEHVPNGSTNDEIIAILKACTNADRDEEDFEDQRRRLLGFPVVDIVKALGQFLSSDDSSVRRESVSLLCWNVSLRADLDVHSVTHILAFFCARLSDWSSVEFAVHGIRELYSKHISPSNAMVFPTEEESVTSKDRSDLSLMLGYANISDLPAPTGSVTERVLTKLLINVHAPSFGRQVRLEVLQLLKLLIKDFHDDLSPIKEIIVKAVAIEGEDERDPNNLCVLFECIEFLFETGLLSESATSRSSEELFDTLKSYFPIEASGDSTEPELVERLKTSMNRCFVRFGVLSIEYLISQLQTSNDDAFLALRQLASKRPSDLIPFLIAEWNSTSPPFVVSLIQTCLEAAAVDYTTSLIQHISEKGDDDLLVIAANTSSRIAEIVIQSIPFEKLHRLLPRIEFKDDQLSLPNTEDLTQSMLDTAEPNIALLSRIVPGLVNKQMLLAIAALVDQQTEVTCDSGRCLAWLLRSPAAESVCTIVDMKRHLGELIQLGDKKSVGRIAVSLFRSRQLVEYVDHLAADWEVAIDAFDDPEFASWIHENQTHTLPSSVVGRLACTLGATLGSALVRKYILEKGRIDVISYLPEPSLLADALGDPEELQDLFSAFIALSAPDQRSIRFLVEVSNMKKWADKLISIIRFCQDDGTWATAITSLTDKNLQENVALEHLTNGRAEALIPVASEELIKSLATNQDSLSSLGVRVRILCSPLVDDFGSRKNVEEMIIESIGCDDLFGFRLAVKYALLDANWSVGFVENLIGKLLEKTAKSQPVIMRFAAVQTLAVLPEMVASGKLKTWKQQVLRELESVVNIEPRFIVRKQAAAAITSWYSLSP